jgi:hypothetical protein
MAVIRTTTVVVLLAFASRARAQAPTDTMSALAQIHQRFVRLGKASGEVIWPGYRPDTIPISYVFPQRGTALFGWRGSLPAGYGSVPGFRGVGWLDQRNLGAASTGTSIDERPVAQVVVTSLSMEFLVPTAFHEAFHVFEHASRRPGLRFGGGENAFYVATYPIFNVRNEALFALEGQLLRSALQENSIAKKTSLARQFAALRRTRQALLDPDFAEFERSTEMNEGLAEYALVRAVQLLASDSGVPAPTRSGARKMLADRLLSLANLASNVSQSFRLRFYQTGPAEALLLDAIGRADWKKQLMEQNQTVQDALALATGLDDPQLAALQLAMMRLDSAGASRAAASRVANLVILRKTQVDSLLSAPGVLLELSASALPAKDFGMCGFDPQNHLQVSPTVQIQKRWWRPCSGSLLRSEFNVPSVHDGETGTVRAVIGPMQEVKLTMDGAPLVLSDGQVIESATDLRLEAPRANVQAARARVSLHGTKLQITPLP